MLTEEEAKVSWCPFARMVWATREPSGTKSWKTSGSPSFNRARIEFSAEEKFPCNCIASRCMAWRWARAEVGGTAPLERQGYCGLAGRP